MELKPLQVLQLNPTTTRNPMFSGCLFVVTEVKTWGAQGYVQSLGENGEPGGQAYYRANFEELETLNEDGTVPYVFN